MAEKIKYLHLSAEQLGLLFTQLHQLELAGLAINRALAILAQTETQLKKPLLIMQQQINLGCPLSEAGFRAGLFNDTHKTLLHAAESSGQLVMVYHQLATYYIDLSSRIKRVKSRLMLSGLVLILALFIQPVPDFVNSAIDAVEYLKLSIGRLIMIALSLFIMIRLPRIFRALGLEYVWHYLQLHTPFVKVWILKRQLNQFFFILAMILESGVAFADALPKAVASIPNVCLRKAFKVALSSVSTGRSVTDILLTVPVMDSEVLHVIASGEHSGKLASSLLHFANLEAETISLQDDALAEWLVRFIYTAIALWMANSILHSSFMPTIAKNL